MGKIFAATSLGKIGGEGLGPFANNTGSPAQTISSALSGIIGILTVCAVIWFMFQFIIGGLNWISSAGDKNKLADARNRITNGLIGLIIVVAAWAIMAIVGQFFGWTDILNPAGVLDKVKFQ